jgi:DNA repair exonuclease SbcCD ATPase subunit
MASNRGRLKLVNYMSDSLGLSQAPKDLTQNEDLDAAAAELISALRAEINELKKRRDLYSLSEVEIVALAGEHTLAIVKASKEAEQRALVEIEKRLAESRKEVERVLKQTEASLKEAEVASQKLITDAESRSKKIEQQAEQLQADTEERIKSKLEALNKEVDQRRTIAAKEIDRLKNETQAEINLKLDALNDEINQKRALAKKDGEQIIFEAEKLAQQKMAETKAKISAELARERTKIEKIRREAATVAKSLEIGYLSIRDQIDTARTTLGQYTSGLEDLTELLSESSDTEN